MLSTPGFNNQQTYPSQNTSLEAVPRREIPTYTRAVREADVMSFENGYSVINQPIPDVQRA